MKFILVVLAVVAAAHSSNGALGISVSSLITELNNLESSFSSQIGLEVEASGKVVSNALQSVNSLLSNAIATGVANASNCAAEFSATAIEVAYNSQISTCLKVESEVVSDIATAVNSLKFPVDFEFTIQAFNEVKQSVNKNRGIAISCIDAVTASVEREARFATTTAYKCLFPIA